MAAMSHMATRQCAPGVLDCGSPATPFGAECAAYDGRFPTTLYSAALIGTGAPIAILMSICIGGNDAANSWGSTVGSGALSLRHAVLLGALAEWLGATLLGQGVSSTIRKGVSDIDDSACWACGDCDSRMSVYAVGMLAALIGAATFLLAATFGKMPVSTTHAVVGGVVGMTLVGTPGIDCLSWDMSGLGGIVASWVISPVLAGLVATLLFVATNRIAICSRSPVRRSLLLLPWLYALTSFVMVALTLIRSKPTQHLGTALHAILPLCCAALAFLLVRQLVLPRVRASIDANFPHLACAGSGPGAVTVGSAASPGVPAIPAAAAAAIPASAADAITAPSIATPSLTAPSKPPKLKQIAVTDVTASESGGSVAEGSGSNGSGGRGGSGFGSRSGDTTRAAGEETELTHVHVSMDGANGHSVDRYASVGANGHSVDRYASVGDEAASGQRAIRETDAHCGVSSGACHGGTCGSGDGDAAHASAAGTIASPPPSPPLPNPQRPPPLAALDAEAAAAAGGSSASVVEGGAGSVGASAACSAPRLPTNLSERPPAEAAAVFVFRYLLVFVAFMEAFVHGANDTANATSAFTAIWVAYTDGLYACSLVEAPWWIMSIAGFFVGVGVITMGYRVIQTIGTDLAPMDYHVGFCVELASTLTVALATVVGGLPVSTTHCKVGAVVCIGVAKIGRRGVDLSLAGKIVLSWVLTLPFAGALAAVLTMVFRAAITIS